MKKKLITAIVVGIMMGAGLLLIFMSGSLAGSYLQYRNHWGVKTTAQTYTESNRQLSNPNRGFYNLYGFVISDTGTGYTRQVVEKMYNDSYNLSLVQINLREYKERPISDIGLENLNILFQALEAEQKQYIIRFLYDWSGEDTEPKDVQIILKHMEQIGPVVEKYSDIIFTFQGIFVGPCAEMHSSVHMEKESMKLLMQQLFQVTPEDTFLSVRTPQQWRILTEISEEADFGTTELSRRLGLFNDGIMGTELDTGTYGITSKTEVGPYSKWTIEEEFEFQTELCKHVPNGGEVIIENPVNDFENAVKRLNAMHVTYLNIAYDKHVLDKWADSSVTEQSVFEGLDGLTYVERHLGYRLLISDTALEYDFWSDRLTVTTWLKNVGFAPMYKEPEAYFVIRNNANGQFVVYPTEAGICALAGGTEAEALLTVSKEFSLAGLPAGEYEVYFYLKDTDSGRYIAFANEQELMDNGYLLGYFTVEELRNPFTEETFDLGKKVGDALKQLEYKQQEEGK